MAIAFVGGEVHTVDTENRICEAVLVDDGRITVTGTTDRVRSLLPRDAEVIDLAGKSLLPGFIDAHCHPTMLGTALAQIDARYPQVASTETLVEAVARRVGETAAGQWVRGWGLDYDKFPGEEAPTRWDLDRVSPEHPVWILHVSGHHALVNSRALALAGIADDVADPIGGRFVRDAAGRPTGLLLDAAQQAVMASPVNVGNHGPSTGIYDAPVDELVSAIERAYREFLRAGITSAVDAQVTGRELRAYIEARRHHRLGVRTTCMMLSNHLEEFERLGLSGPLGDDWLALGPMKLYSDGALSGSTAVFTDAYQHEEGFHGVSYWSPEELDGLVGRAHRLGLQVGIHAQGDAGIRTAVDAIERALADTPRDDHRHRIEHFGAPAATEIERVARLGIIPVSNPRFVYEVGDTFWDNLGEERANRTYPLGSELRAGARVVFGSDTPVASFEPMGLIWASMTRQTLGGRGMTAEDRLTFEQALRACTIDAAYSIRQEAVRGSIEAGKLADLVVVDGPLSGAPAATVQERQVEMTVVGGEIAWRNGG